MEENRMQIVQNNIKLEDNKEESYEEYETIQEDYCSSPKCGIKSKIVTKSVEKMIFSPVEISTKPYFQCCITPLKDEKIKLDFSQSETNNTRNQNVSNKIKDSYKDIEQVLKEEQDEQEFKEEKDLKDESNKEKEELEDNIGYNKKEDEKKINPNTDNKKVRKRTLSMSVNFHSKKLKNKLNGNNMHNIFILNGEINNNNIIIGKEAKKFKRTKTKTFSIFNSVAMKKDILKNIKQKISPFNIYKEKNDDQLKVIASFTTTNINRLKKKKRSKCKESNTNNNEVLKMKNINDYLIKNNKEKKKEKKENLLINISEDEYINQNSNNKSKKKLRGQIEKSTREKSDIIRKGMYSSKDSINRKSRDFLNDRFYREEKLIKENNINDPKKKPFGLLDSGDNKNNYNENNVLFNVKREKDNLIKRKQSNDKDGEKNKKKKKKKKKSKKKFKRFEKDDNILKNSFVKKYSAKNLKFLFKDQKEQKETKCNVVRKDKSKTIICKNNLNNLRFSTKLASQKANLANSLFFKNQVTEKNSNSVKRPRGKSLKSNFILNLSSSKGYNRRNSTKVLFNKSQKEKITEFTNKQNIDDINEYVRKCLEIIPDLYALKELPRCKTKINFNVTNQKKMKKYALFDLDETLVHCIGEINLNTVECFSRQSDAKIKVLLPGGKEVTIGINIRPYWKKALNLIKDKYHIVAYTASHESYADSVLNYLDPDKKIFEFRLYRNHCVLCSVDEMKFYVKDLGIFENFCDLKDVVLIDNSVLSFAYHLDNGIPISPFYDSKKDCELLEISNFLYRYADEYDIRNKLREVYKLSEYLEIIKNNISEDSVNSSISIVQEELDAEASNKNCLNIKNNKISFADLNNKYNIEEIKEMNEENELLYDKRKQSYHLNIFNKTMSSLEKNKGNNEKRSRSFSFKRTKSKYFDLKNFYLFINKNKIRNTSTFKLKKKFKSFKYCDINFQKEWEEKQKELNNQ